MKTFTLFFSFFGLLIFIGCSAKSTVRYDQPKDSKIDNKKNNTSVNFKEEFDFSPYRSDFNISEININKSEINTSVGDVWYDYPSTSSADKVFVSKTNGFRVLVMVTDILEQATEMRSDIYFKTNQKEIYVDFESPFYRVKVGDFIDISKARELSFKLNQMGYQSAKVIPDSINIFE